MSTPIREEIWHPPYRTAPEPGRKVFVIREADRLSPAAADTLLKVLEEPPADAVLLLLSARAHELPDTVLSRCHVVTFTALPERFVVEALAGDGVDATRARLAARLTGGNLGRARRMARDPDGLRSATPRRRRSSSPREGPTGALWRPSVVLAAAKGYKERIEGRARGRARAVPRREGPSRGRLSRRDQADRDSAHAAGAARGARLRRLGAAGGLVAAPRPDRRRRWAAASRCC